MNSDNEVMFNVLVMNELNEQSMIQHHDNEHKKLATNKASENDLVSYFNKRFIINTPECTWLLRPHFSRKNHTVVLLQGS
jgi:hypothetical protein